MVTRQGCGMGIGGCNRLCPTATGHSLIALFSWPCRLRTIRCMDPSQVTNILSRAHTCLWEREDLLLSCHGLWLFPDRLIGGGDRWRSMHHFEAGPQVWGSGTGWYRLCLGCKWGVCFSGYPAGHIDSRIAVSTWRYDLTTLWHHSKNWHMKDEKWLWLLHPCLIIEQVLI
jgi:hypothetical protein